MGGTRQHTPVSTPRGSSLHPSAKCFTAHRQDPESPPAPYGRVPACNLGGRKSWSISISISLLRSDGFVFEPDLGKFDFSLLLRVHSLRDKNQLSATALSCSLVFFFFFVFFAVLLCVSDRSRPSGIAHDRGLAYILNGSSNQISRHKDLLVLPEPLRSANRLAFHAWVPLRLKDEDVARDGEVQSTKQKKKMVSAWT